VSLLPPRLTGVELQRAKRAGYMVPRASKSSFFGSMFSWFPAVRFGRPTFWPVSGNSKPPINAAESSTGQIVTPASALTLSASWACCWLTARTMASMPLDLKRYKKNGKGTLEEDNPLYEVLRWRPNTAMTAYDFWTAQWMSVLLWGNGYALKRRNGGNVIALDFLLPEYMTVYQTDAGKIRYRYDDPRNQDDFPADDIFHLRERTLDGLTGASVIEFARNSMGIAQSGELAAGKTFKKGLNATGFIKVDKFLRKEQREEFRTEIDEFGSDGPKAGGTMILEGGTDYKQLSMKPLDAELLASRQFSVEDVCRWFGTPPILIGHSTQGQTMWGSGIEQIFRGWLNISLRPYITCCTQAVRASLVKPADRAELYAEYDLDDLLAADSLSRSQLYSTYAQNGIKTRNELREKEGDGPLPGGDELTVQSNLVPLASLGQQAQGSGTASAAAEKARNALIEFLQLAATPPAEGPKS
jgi:HK97 family phage portal protein